MISSQHRFHGHASLSFVYRRGTTVRNQFMALRFAHNPRRSAYRAAVIVSRKVHKSAVKRNRVRRRLYAIVQHYGSQITAPCDLVLSVYSDQVVDIPVAELERMVGQLLHKSGVTRPGQPAHAIVNRSEKET